MNFWCLSGRTKRKFHLNHGNKRSGLRKSTSGMSSVHLLRVHLLFSTMLGLVPAGGLAFPECFRRVQGHQLSIEQCPSLYNRSVMTLRFPSDAVYFNERLSYINKFMKCDCRTSCACNRSLVSSTASFFVVNVLSLRDVRLTDCALWTKERKLD